MKVKVKDLKPNPFRDLSNYPFNEDKINRLKKSIEQTGFWDNILARQVNGEIQIAYGHHRLRALKEVYSPDYMVEVPIKDLSDELMLKIMANENMEEWQSSVSVIDETVRAVIKFMRKSGSIDTNKRISVANFLGWPHGRVKQSLNRISAIDDSGISKQAVEMIPKSQAATTFVAKAKAHKLTVPQQKKVAKIIAESENYSPEAVTSAVLDEAYPKKERTKQKESKQQQKIIEFDQYLINLSDRATELKNEIVSLRGLKKEIVDFSYSQFESRVRLKLSLEGLQLSIENTLNELNTKNKNDEKV